MLLGDREMGNGLGGKRYELIGWVWHLDGGIRWRLGMGFMKL